MVGRVQQSSLARGPSLRSAGLRIEHEALLEIFALH